jgi:hypothetical protein
MVREVDVRSWSCRIPPGAHATNIVTGTNRSSRAIQKCIRVVVAGVDLHLELGVVGKDYFIGVEMLVISCTLGVKPARLGQVGVITRSS